MDLGAPKRTTVLLRKLWRAGTPIAEAKVRMNGVLSQRTQLTQRH